MAYVIQITNVQRHRPTGVQISYELRDTSTTPETVVDNGQAMKDGLLEVIQSIIDRTTTADADYSAIQAALSGLRHPAG